MVSSSISLVYILLMKTCTMKVLCAVQNLSSLQMQGAEKG